MELQIFMFLILLSHISQAFRESEYCCTLCYAGVHTVCKYPKGGIGKDCVRFMWGTITPTQRVTLLKMHNALRQQIANGEITQMPAAANMLELIWDDELEFIAKRWNDQCIYAHDKCRNSFRFEVGQNMAYSYTKTAESMVQFWFDEYLITPLHYLDKLTSITVNETVGGKVVEKKTGHFTQMVWAKSYRVGCSVNVQYEVPEFKKTIICNYGPSGNILNEESYKKGPGCSQCPEGTECSTTYPGLCALRCSKIYPSFCSGAEVSASLPNFIILLLLFLFYQ